MGNSERMWSSLESENYPIAWENGLVLYKTVRFCVMKPGLVARCWPPETHI